MTFKSVPLLAWLLIAGLAVDYPASAQQAPSWPDTTSGMLTADSQTPVVAAPVVASPIPQTSIGGQSGVGAKAQGSMPMAKPADIATNTAETLPIQVIDQISTQPSASSVPVTGSTSGIAAAQPASMAPAAGTTMPPVNAAPVASVTATPLPAGIGAQLAQTSPTAATGASEPTTAVTPIVVTPQPAQPRKIEIPVPIVSSTASPAGTSGLLILPLNKTKSIDLDKTVRDVIIGNPDIADIVVRSQKQIYLVGKTIGDTNVFLVDDHGNLIRKVEVTVAPDVEGVQSNITSLLPGERIEAKGMGDSVVLSGTASSDGAAAKARDIARRFVAKDENVISMLRVTNEQQVLLRVRVAEAQKSVLKELGVDNLLSPQTLGPLTIRAATTALGLQPVIGGVAGLLGVSTDDSDTAVRLLERHGYIRTLAEPNLLAVSGETASMLAGGEYPIPIAQQNGTISVQYKPFGVILSFLPVVIDGGQISLRISTEVSALSDQNTVTAAGFTFKSFITRRANSVVEMPSGGNIMIAGLLQNDITDALNGVPGLMDVPVLGSLFRSTSFQRNETELVILVSAILAKPTDPRQLALPTDGFVPSTDLDRYFLGHLQNIYLKKPAEGPTAPQSLQGPIGYIVR